MTPLPSLFTFSMKRSKFLENWVPSANDVTARSVTSWGTLETRIEGDFGGGAAGSTNAVFRLRQAWGELGDESFRVLIGQANSLWNEGVFETLIDATNLNQSFVRQAQIRLTGRLAEGLIEPVPTGFDPAALARAVAPGRPPAA